MIERPSPWTGNRPAGETLTIPIKHDEGAWYVLDDEAERLAANGQVLLRYAADVNGATAPGGRRLQRRRATCSA